MLARPLLSQPLSPVSVSFASKRSMRSYVCSSRQRFEGLLGARRRALIKAPTRSLIPLRISPLPSTSLTLRWHSSSQVYPPYQPPRKGILSILPSPWVPYAELMRIEKPGGLYGGYLPYLIGLSYAACVAQPAISPVFLASTSAGFLIWTFFLRGASCVINDNLDREYDRQVARCRSRPIARGAVTPSQGHIFYTGLTVICAGVVTQLPHAVECFYYAIPIHLLLSVYPLGKRFTDFPQLILCVPLSGAIFMSCAALGVDPLMAHDTSVAIATACITASQAIWIIIFDYVNACQDTIDDIKAGVRSMAVRYQDTFAFISILGTAQVSLLVAAGVLSGMSPIYFAISCGGNAFWLAAIAMTVNRSKPHISGWWFSWGSLIMGGTTVAGLLGEYAKNLLKGDIDEGDVEEKEESISS